MKRVGLLITALSAVTLVAAVAMAKPAPKTSVTIAVPHQVVYGSAITITGQASGKNAGGARITLYAEPAPTYSTPKAVSTATAGPAGQYKFTTAPDRNTIYFVRVHTAPQVTSPNAKVLVKVSVSLSLTGGAGHMFFIGSVLPDYAGRSVVIQRRGTHHWNKVATARLASASSVPTALGTTTRSKYHRRLRLRSGTYRVFFAPKDGLRIANQSPKRSI